MISLATYLLNAALALLLSVQMNTAATHAQRQQVIGVTSQAIQLAEQVRAQTGLDATLGGSSSTGTSSQHQSTSTFYLSPSSGPPGTVATLSISFSVCGNQAPPGECTEDRFDDYQLLQDDSVVADSLPFVSPTDWSVPQIEIPLSTASGTYELAVKNCLGIGCSTYPLAPFRVTTPSSPQKISITDVSPRSGLPGTQITISGRGFSKLTLTYPSRSTSSTGIWLTDGRLWAYLASPDTAQITNDDTIVTTLVRTACPVEE